MIAWLLRRAVWLGAIAAVGYVGACLFVYDKLSRVRAKCRGLEIPNTPSSFTLAGVDVSAYQMGPFEEVSFPARADPGVALAGWWVPAHGPVADPADPGPAVILVHGLEGCRRDGENLLAAGMLHKHGIGVLLFDLRDHGDSTVVDGRYAGGSDEYRDVLGAWDYLRSQGFPEARIGLIGFSLGAATAMIAFGEDPRIAALWADSSFADIGSALRDELRRAGYPAWLAPGGILAGRYLRGSDLAEKSPLEAARRVGTRSVALTHGALDDRIAVHHIDRLAEAIRAGGGSVEPWVLIHLGHTQALLQLTAEYEARLAAFFGAALGPPAEGSRSGAEASAESGAAA